MRQAIEEGFILDVLKGYSDVRCLVAFSGEVQDDQLPGISYTEPQMNAADGKPIKETELPTRFASDRYQVLIVATKYQTGFDQPLLCAMYVDKRLAGIQAVQTLSRLNRTHPGKEQTVVLDFVNDRKTILDSFQDYYEATTTEDTVDPQRLYELQHELDEFQVYTPSEVDGFAAVFYQLPADKRVVDNAELNTWLDPAVDRFKALKTVDSDATGAERQEAFRGKLVAFRNLYGFLGQIVPFTDPDLEKRYAFTRMLRRKLSRPDGGGLLDLGDDVVLQSYKLKLEDEGDLTLEVNGISVIRGPDYAGAAHRRRPPSGSHPSSRSSTSASAPRSTPRTWSTASRPICSTTKDSSKRPKPTTRAISRSRSARPWTTPWSAATESTPTSSTNCSPMRQWVTFSAP
jgi:type I restriction enzyme R subunit